MTGEGAARLDAPGACPLPRRRGSIYRPGPIMDQLPTDPVKLPFWARRPAPRAKRFYDLEVLPKQAGTAGRFWAEDFARLSTQEQRTIIAKMTVGTLRYWARRMGYPEPIITETLIRDDGTTEERPLRPEWGGAKKTRTGPFAPHEEPKAPTKTNIPPKRKAAKGKFRLVYRPLSPRIHGNPAVSVAAVA